MPNRLIYKGPLICANHLPTRISNHLVVVIKIGPDHDPTCFLLETQKVKKLVPQTL